MRSVYSPLTRLNTRKCCICKINNRPVWHNLFYITKYSDNHGFYLTLWSGTYLFLPTLKKKEAGKAGRKTIKLVFWQGKIEKVIQAPFPPIFFRFSIFLRQENEIRSQINIINYPDYNKIWTSPDNYYQSTKISLISQPKFRQHYKDRNKKISSRFSFIPPFTVPDEMVAGRKCIKPCRDYSSG